LQRRLAARPEPRRAASRPRRCSAAWWAPHQRMWCASETSGFAEWALMTTHCDRQGTVSRAGDGGGPHKHGRPFLHGLGRCSPGLTVAQYFGGTDPSVRSPRAQGRLRGHVRQSRRRPPHETAFSCGTQDEVRQVVRSRHQGHRLPAPREPGGYRPDLATDAVATPECSLDEWAPGSMLRARPATVSRPPHSAAGRKVSGVNSPIGPTAACLTLLLILSTVSIGRFPYKSNRPRPGNPRHRATRCRRRPSRLE